MARGAGGAARLALEQVPLDRVRAFWRARQEVGQAVAGDLADCLARTGWIYSAGSTSPYLSLRARRPGLGRAEVDAAVFSRQELVEAPGVRGATFLMARADLPLALAAARRFHADKLVRLGHACSLAADEIAGLGERLLPRLAVEPATADELRRQLPPGLSRDLGEAGRKLGEPTSLGVALRDLQVAGRVERMAASARLDSREFRYRLAASQPGRWDETRVDRDLVGRFLSWAGPATTAEIAFWADLARGPAVAAARAAGAVTIGVEGLGAECWVLEADLPALRAAEPASGGEFRFLPFRDNLVYARRAPVVLAEPSAAEVRVLDWRMRSLPLAEVESLHHHALLLGDRLAGLWEVDGQSRRVETGTFVALGAARRRDLGEAAAAIERFIGEELGDLRFYAADGPRTRRARLEAVRSLPGWLAPPRPRR